MNGERNNYWLNAGVALAISLVMSSIIFGWFFAKSKKTVASFKSGKSKLFERQILTRFRHLEAQPKFTL